MLQSRLDILAHDGNDNEYAENSVNNTGDGSEQVNKKLKRVRNFLRSQLGQKNRSANPERNGNQESHRCGHHRAINKGQGTKLFGNGIPNARGKKVWSKLMTGKTRIVPKLEHEQNGD